MMDLQDLNPRILDFLYDGVYCVDTRRIITYWNQAAERLTGFNRQEVAGRCCADNILQHSDADGQPLCRGKCPLHATMEDGQARESRVFLLHRDGHRVPVSVRCSPIFDDHGQVIGGVEVFNDASNLELIQQRVQDLERLSLIDPLTQLANRRYLDHTLEQCLQELRRYGWPFAVFMADIDNFKSINDTHGHLAGDAILRMVARTMNMNARPFDLMGRWGGEEFLGIVRNVGHRELYLIMERMRKLTASSHVETETGVRLSVTISLGGSVVRLDDTIEELLARTDRMLYQSKQNGKNCSNVAGQPVMPAGDW